MSVLPIFDDFTFPRTKYMVHGSENVIIPVRWALSIHLPCISLDLRKPLNCEITFHFEFSAMPTQRFTPHECRVFHRIEEASENVSTSLLRASLSGQLNYYIITLVIFFANKKKKNIQILSIFRSNVFWATHDFGNKITNWTRKVVSTNINIRCNALVSHVHCPHIVYSRCWHVLLSFDAN